MLLYQNILKGARDYPSFLFIYLFTYLLYHYVYLCRIPAGGVKVLPPSLTSIFLMWSTTRHLGNSMISAEPTYINSVPQISWYNLVIYQFVGPCFFISKSELPLI